MAELKSLPIDKIHVAPDRSRPVDEDHALAIQAEIVAGEFTDPILVRRTSRRKGQPYTLVDGAHRLRAMVLLGETEILCVVIEADADSAELFETGANLFRHMTVLDRAVAVKVYREAWERKFGKVTRGGDQSDRLSLCSIDTVASEAERGFSVNCAERMGFSKRSIERSVRIATHLPADLVDRLRGTSIADNQSQLLALSGLAPEKLAKAARALELAAGDYAAMMELLGDAPAKQPLSEPQKAFSRIVDSWDRIGPAQKWQALDHIEVADLLTDDQRAVLAERFGGPRPIGDGDV